MSQFTNDTQSKKDLFFICKTCGSEYTLYDLPYEKANPLIRDYCIDCIADMQEQYKKARL
jgi:hypothetical protein